MYACQLAYCIIICEGVDGIIKPLPNNLCVHDLRVYVMYLYINITGILSQLTSNLEGEGCKLRCLSNAKMGKNTI